MAEQVTASPQQPAQENTSSSTTTTVTIDAVDAPQNVQTVHLKLRKPKPDRKVKWTNETVDNEDMDKKKSKSCCIYKKPLAFGESSSESDSSDDEDDKAPKAKKHHHHHDHDHDHDHEYDHKVYAQSTPPEDSIPSQPDTKAPDET